MVRHADFSYAILGKTISIVDLDLGGPVGPMDNHVHNFNPEWPPDKIIGTHFPRAGQRRPHRTMSARFGSGKGSPRGCFTTILGWFSTIVAVALLVNAITFLCSKLSMHTDVSITCITTNLLLVVCCALTLFEGQRSTKWFRNYASSVRRLLRDLE